MALVHTRVNSVSSVRCLQILLDRAIMPAVALSDEFLVFWPTAGERDPPDCAHTRSFSVYAPVDFPAHSPEMAFK